MMRALRGEEISAMARRTMNISRISNLATSKRKTPVRMVPTPPLTLVTLARILVMTGLNMTPKLSAHPRLRRPIRSPSLPRPGQLAASSCLMTLILRRKRGRLLLMRRRTPPQTPHHLVMTKRRMPRTPR